MSDAGEGGLGVHSTGGSLQYVYARPPPAKCIFFSLRFGAEHGVVPMAEALRGVLAGHGLTAVIINMAAGGDIDTQVFEWIEHCDTFVVFGSPRYGEDTGNQACTYYEYKHAFAKKKRIILLRMIPFDQEFEELQARVIFNANRLALPWMVGQPMPLDLPLKILDALGLGGAAQRPPTPTAGVLPSGGLGQPPTLMAPTRPVQKELTTSFLAEEKLEQYTRA